MGFGDALIASAQARALNEETRLKVAIGDGKALRWGTPEIEVFRGNPRLATQQDIDRGEVTWLVNCTRRRPYIDYARMLADHKAVCPEEDPWKVVKKRDGRFPWHFTGWTVPGPGELYLSQPEISRAREKFAGRRFAVIEPGIKNGASPNKVWPFDRYKDIASRLRMSFVQFNPVIPLPGAWSVRTGSYREACAILSLASLYVGTEGGLHHAAAAFGVPSVVYHGGYIRPWGYPRQRALYREHGSPCGQRVACPHCQEIARDITADEAMDAIEQVMDEPL